MSTENSKEQPEPETLQLFVSDSTRYLTKELFESLVAVVVGGALGQIMNVDQITHAKWVLERTNSLTLEFRPDSRQL